MASDLIPLTTAAQMAREALRALLATPEISDADPRDKDEETHAAERLARKALAALEADGWREFGTEPRGRMVSERDELVQTIGCFLDHPNVYMGGASPRSRRNANAVIEPELRERYARIAEKFAPECSGPDYGMASEEERKQMRGDRDFAYAIAAAIRADKNP